jgi:diguanylate cyclase (GGDEF)-like protein
MTRHLLNLFSRDIDGIHTALLAAGKGKFEPDGQTPAIRETEYLMPDIEALAKKLHAGQDQADRKDVTDPLTGLYNRRYFDLLLSHSYEQSKRQMPAHLVVIAVREYRHVFDTLGQTRVDEILRTVAEHLRAHSRASDTLTRIDDDRFGLILHNMAGTVIEGWVQQLADDYDAKIAETAPPICSEDACRLILGVTLVDAQLYDQPHQVLDSASEAVRRAAQGDARPGRSQVVIDGTSEPLARAESF